MAVSPADIFDDIVRLRAAGRPFCVATVVRTADVTSAKAGAKAAVTADGEILGHLGGACVKRAVREAAVGALASGEPQLIRVRPAASVTALTDADGVRLFKSGCPSGGTVDLLIEPYRRPPMVAVFGVTPVAAAIVRQAALVGLGVAANAGLDLEKVAAAGIEGVDLNPLGLDAGDFVVVASQGEGDLAALRAAVESPVRHVSMVASARKATTLKRRLAAAGVPPARLDRVKAPAGLDLGGIDPAEIALSVVAEIVTWRTRMRLDARHTASAR